MTAIDTAPPVAPLRTRGTSNGNVRGSSESRRRRRVWILDTYAADVPGYCRCYRCGVLLYNPDVPPTGGLGVPLGTVVYPLTIDRIVPGCRGGTYRRENIRPACAGCNSETGGRERSKVGRK